MNFRHRAVVLIFLFVSSFNSNAQLGETQIAEIRDYSNVAGTFHFETPTGEMHFWTVEFIEGLHTQIEDLRDQTEIYYWEYSNDMTIVIYPRVYLESPEFTPINSPYDGYPKL